MNQQEFAALLDEYRARDIHFLHLKTSLRDWFFIIDDSYYLTYRDDKKEIVLSLKFWLRMDDIKPFNYVLREPVNSPAINLSQIEEIVPAHTSIRFVFDNGSVEVLKKILNK